MDVVEVGPRLSPGLVGFMLNDAHEQERQPAEEQVGSDPVWQMVVDAAQFEGGLQGPEGVLDLAELLIAEGDVLGAEAGAGRGEQELPVELRLVCGARRRQ